MNENSIVLSSGNVFADLGIEQPEEALVKAQLVSRLADIIEERGMTQMQAASILGITQLKVSALLRGHFDGFSLERLFRLLIALDTDITITMKPKSEERGRLRVVTAGA